MLDPSTKDWNLMDEKTEHDDLRNFNFVEQYYQANHLTERIAIDPTEIDLYDVILVEEPSSRVNLEDVRKEWAEANPGYFFDKALRMNRWGRVIKKAYSLKGTCHLVLEYSNGSQKKVVCDLTEGWLVKRDREFPRLG